MELEQDPKEFDDAAEQMIELGEHCSMTERRADEATRDGDNYVLEGNLFEVDGSDPLTIGAWGTSAREGLRDYNTTDIFI
mgnify:CR=1 FL=1